MRAPQATLDAARHDPRCIPCGDPTGIQCRAFGREYQS
jgi:hypothetical protein